MRHKKQHGGEGLLLYLTQVWFSFAALAHKYCMLYIGNEPTNFGMWLNSSILHDAIWKANIWQMCC